jgi:hypothetical protein
MNEKELKELGKLLYFWDCFFDDNNIGNARFRDKIQQITTLLKGGVKPDMHT